MSETKHTPEKWVAVPLGFRWHTNEKPIFENGLWQIVRSDFPELMPVATVDRGDDHDEQTRIDAEKVARLIAAAPTMLEALKLLVAESGAGIGFAEDEIRAAIGNTNFSCLQRAREVADAAIKLAEEGQ